MTLASVALTFCFSALAAEPDPFAGVAERAAASSPAAPPASLLGENFGFRKELMSQLAASELERPSSRQSIGFEALKKFSTETATKAAFNFQGRLVRRDRFVPVQNDMEGMHRAGWWFEYHNAYLDLYNVLDPLLSEERQGRHVGRFNVRAGRFYVPFGLNLQTDTHGALLQLSNEQHLGFERDWYAGLWGHAGEHASYDAYYLAGSGYYPKWEGQSGLAAARLSLANRFSSEYGLEGGVSALAGERLVEHAPLATRRLGVDGRWRRGVPTGLFTATAELAGGKDDSDLIMQLYQAEYLHGSRRWGLAAQLRRLWKDGRGADASVLGEVSWYFRNDVGNSNLHWLKLGLERKAPAGPARRDVIVALQYYNYW